MCTAASWDVPAKSLRAQFPFLAEAILPEYQRRLIRPSEPMMTLRPGQKGSKAEVSLETFGIRDRSRPGPDLRINARCENIGRVPLWKELFGASRCVVFIDGFYEARPGNPAEKYRFGEVDESGQRLPSALAALRHSSGVVVLTRAAVEPVASVHARQPLFLRPDAVEAWLWDTPDAAKSLMAEQPPALKRQRISPDAYKIGRDNPNSEALIEEWCPPAEQQTLF